MAKRAVSMALLLVALLSISPTHAQDAPPGPIAIPPFTSDRIDALVDFALRKFRERIDERYGALEAVPAGELRKIASADNPCSLFECGPLSGEEVRRHANATLDAAKADATNILSIWAIAISLLTFVASVGPGLLRLLRRRVASRPSADTTG